MKRVLKDADLILIVSRIQRAVNDRSARTLLNDSFRRQIFMDGRAGTSTSIAFVCTQTDLLNRRELARNLRLDENTATKRECALQRNAFATRRIKDDFRAGLRDVALAAAADGDEEAMERGLAPDVEARLERVKLPVFCVSSREAMALSGLLDEAPSVFGDLVETGIPALASFLYFCNVNAAANAARALSTRALQLLDSVAQLVRESDAPLDNSAQLRNLFEARFVTLKQALASLPAQAKVDALVKAYRDKQGSALTVALTGGQSVTQKYCEKWQQVNYAEDACMTLCAFLTRCVCACRVGGRMVCRSPVAKAACIGLRSRRCAGAAAATRAPQPASWTSTRT